MHVAIFSARPYERDHFDAEHARRPGGGHVLTFHESRLTPATTALAAGADAVCVFANDQVNADVLRALAHGGTRVSVTPQLQRPLRRAQPLLAPTAPREPEVMRPVIGLEPHRLDDGADGSATIARGIHDEAVGRPGFGERRRQTPGFERVSHGGAQRLFVRLVRRPRAVKADDVRVGEADVRGIRNGCVRGPAFSMRRPVAAIAFMASTTARRVAARMRWASARAFVRRVAGAGIVARGEARSRERTLNKR